MKASVRVLGFGVILSTALVGCKSSQEAAGDQFLKAGDPVNAVMQYDNAMTNGKISSSFYSNYIKANVELLDARSNDNPAADYIDNLEDTIATLLKQNPNPAEEADFAGVLFEVGQKRLKLGTPQGDEGAFIFFRTADSLQNKPADLDSKISTIRDAYITGKLKDVQSTLDQITKDDAQPGIVADYDLNQLQLILGGKATPAMSALWSKVREKNLSTYMIYDAEGVLDQVDPRINKYGSMSIGIVKYVPGSKTMIQAKVWNGSTGPLNFDGSNFHLVDTSGHAYAPAAAIGAFKKKSDVAKGEESKTGGLTFMLPGGAKADYLEMKMSDGRVTRKFLP